jgi:hypothetical protein
MQFYIIHPNPETNAKMLPDYALKKVNIREGWQILSDIGHLFGVTWVGQYKQYNPYHVLTKSFWINQEAFMTFKSHYRHCLDEYSIRFGKGTSWHQFFHYSYNTLAMLTNVIPNKTIEQQNLEYLLTVKKKFLTTDDIKRLNNVE